jgi:hypothetical protein
MSTQATTAAAHDRRVIQPLVLITLDADTAPLAAAATLEVSARHPAALPFFCSLGFTEAAAGAGDRIRRAFESVTDLAERENALLDGYAIADRIRVVVALFLGAPAGEELLETMVESVHRIGGSWFDQTPIELHALVFLPDLAVPGARETRYHDGYRQLCLLDSILSARAALRPGARPAVDRAWLLDCRTQTGAHAGTLEDVLEPAATLVALLADGASDVLTGIDGHADVPPPTAFGRAAAYSSFGTATLRHYPALMARLLAARAAIIRLASYGLSGVAESVPERVETTPPVAEGEPEDDGVAAALTAWAERVRLRDALLDPLDPALAAIDRDDDPSAAGRQARHREETMARIERAAADGVREWLAQRGIDFAARVLRAADGRIDAAEALPVIVPGLSLAALRTEWREALREALDIDHLIARLASLPRFDGLGVAPDSQAALDVQSTRIALEEQIADRRWLLQDHVSPEAVDDALRSIVDARRADETEPAPEAVHAAADASTTPPPPDRPAARFARWVAHVRDRIAGRRHGRADATDAGSPPVGDAGGAPDVAARGPGARPAPLTAAQAWRLVERKRCLDAYASLLARLRASLGRHTADLTAVVEYYQAVATPLEQRITARTNFRLPVHARTDLERYAASWLPALVAELEKELDPAKLARLFTLDGADPAHAGNARDLLEELDATLTEVARRTIEPVARETLADVLAGHGPTPVRLAPADTAAALFEAASPLVRPRAVENVAAAEPGAWIVADPALRAWLDADDDAAALLAGMSTLPAPLDPNRLTVLRVLHGFPAFAVRKVRELRFGAASRGAARSHPYPDLVPLEAAQAEADAERLLRTLVIARALGVLSAVDHYVSFDDEVIAGDLVDVAHAVSWDASRRPLERAVEAEVSRQLATAEGGERLRRALHDDALAPAEQRVVLDVVAELEGQREAAALFAAPPAEAE